MLAKEIIVDWRGCNNCSARNFVILSLLLPRLVLGKGKGGRGDLDRGWVGERSLKSYPYLVI